MLPLLGPAFSGSASAFAHPPPLACFPGLFADPALPWLGVELDTALVPSRNHLQAQGKGDTSSGPEGLQKAASQGFECINSDDAPPQAAGLQQPSSR